MLVSARFRDIFGSGPLKIRRTDKPATAGHLGSGAETGAGSTIIDAESIWLDITAAHRRAARTFTPHSIRFDDLAGEDR